MKVEKKQTEFQQQSEEALKKYMLHVKENTKGYLGKLSAEELNRKIAVPWSDKLTQKSALKRCYPHGYRRHDSRWRVIGGSVANGFGSGPYRGFWQ